MMNWKGYGRKRCARICLSKTTKQVSQNKRSVGSDLNAGRAESKGVLPAASVLWFHEIRLVRRREALLGILLSAGKEERGVVGDITECW